jgi:hypothetical protein
MLDIRYRHCTKILIIKIIGLSIHVQHPEEILFSAKNKYLESAKKETLGRSRKDPHSPHGGNFCRPEGDRGEKKLFLIIVNVLGHPKGVGGLTSYFLRGGGMDVFWNDPF